MSAERQRLDSSCSPSASDIAFELASAGWAPVPIPHKKKSPNLREWQKRVIGPEDVPQYFNGRPQNVGVLLGAPSKGRVDVDLDAPEAVAMGPRFLPGTVTFGRSSKPRSHFLYVAAGAKTTKYQDPLTKEMLVELRSTGCQTVMPGSTHPSGELVEWTGGSSKIAGITELEAEELSSAVAELASAALVARYWPEVGGIHEAALCLAGALVRSGWSIERGERFIRAVCQYRNCADTERHVACVRDSQRKYQEGTTIKAWGAFADALPNGHVLARTLKKWLKAPDTRPANALKQTQLEGHGGYLLPRTFATTDLGNAERFVALFGGRARYCPQRKRWLTWQTTRWAWDECGEVERFAKRTVRAIYQEAASCRDDEQRRTIGKHARESENAGRIREMLRLAQSEEGIPVTLAQLDADPYLLNCSNGTLDLRTGSLRTHDPKDLITKSTGIAFSAHAQSELWNRVLCEATGGDNELATYVQRAIGSSLLGLPAERVFFFLYGPPGTSKSTLVISFHSALGDYAQSASADTWLRQSCVGGNRGDLVRLAGARLVTSVEVRHGASWDESLIKAVTGGDAITAAAKFEADVSFTPSFTLLLAANDAPNAREDDDGLWVRMRRIPLTAQIPPERQDRRVKEQLRAPVHAEAVLAWAVQGCLTYQRDGLGTSRAVAESTSDYRASLDYFAEFVVEECVVDPTARVSRSEIRRAYEAWAREAGRRPLNDRELAKKLRERGCGEVKTNGTRGWLGISLREPHD